MRLALQQLVAGGAGGRERRHGAGAGLGLVTEVARGHGQPEPVRAGPRGIAQALHAVPQRQEQRADLPEAPEHGEHQGARNGELHEPPVLLPSRQARDEALRLLEHGRGVPEGVRRVREARGQRQVLDRAPGLLGADEVPRELIGDLGVATGIGPLESAAHHRVEHPPGRRQQLGVRDLPHPVVGELQALAHDVQHPPGDQRLHRLRAGGGRELRGPLEQREVHLASDDRRDGRDVAGLVRQSPEPLRDGAPDALRQREARGGRRGRVVAEPAQGLDDDERVALAGRPDAVDERPEHRRVGPDARQQPDERLGVWA